MLLQLGRNKIEMSNIVIGIEGLVGAGKTSICRKLTEIIPNTVMFNGGNLYRAIVYGLMKSGKSLDKLRSAGKSIDIKEMMDFLKIEIKFEDKESMIYIDGVKIDEEANDCRGVERLITTEDSTIPCYIIPTNEELMIAMDTYDLIK